MKNPDHHSIRFILDGRVTEVSFTPAFRPSVTLLNYLRSLPGHKGVKEGCGEGDCGACTVVMAAVGSDGKLHYRAIDSCLVFLPMIHGMQVITVENLAETKQSQLVLHPVQQALVSHHGTQCGYCTPGVVMSMFGLYKNHHQPDDGMILDALAGNLCRCTGYQSILEAAREATTLPDHDQFTHQAEEIIGMLNGINADRNPLILEGGGQRYFRPFTREQALTLRRDHPEAVIINGSTDIALRQTKKGELIPSILDLSGVDDLCFLKERGSQIIIGSGLRLENLKQWSKDHYPPMYDILKVFGSLQIRNMATLGGNIGSASPIGDLLPLLMVKGAKIVLQSTEGERIQELHEFITGYRKTGIRSGEIIAEVIIDKPLDSEVVRCYKVSKRTDLDIATVSASFSLVLRAGVTETIRMAYGGMAAQTMRVSVAEGFLSGKPWSREVVEQAVKLVEDAFIPITDARAGAAYRRKVAGKLLLKFYSETC